jgi:hypothetical protein
LINVINEASKAMKKPKKLVYGHGVNDSDYPVSTKVDGKFFICPYYQRWREMIRRCYSEKYHKKWPTYKNCRVCEEWLVFSNFKRWMELQDWKGKHLDKDLLMAGNDVYCPELCLFIDGITNTFLTDRKRDRGSFLIGSSWDRVRSKFQARCRSPFTKKQETLGYFDSDAEANKAWLERKVQHAIRLAAIQTDRRASDALIRFFASENKTH